MAVDGWGVSVELRDDASYRAYHYGNPERSDSPEARRAVRIADVLTALRASIRSADVAREYRGATSGAYRSGFRACGNDEEWEFRGDLTWLAERAGLALPPAPAGSRRFGGLLRFAGRQPGRGVAREAMGSAYDRVLEPWEVLEVREWTGTECQGASEPRGLDPAGAV